MDTLIHMQRERGRVTTTMSSEMAVSTMAHTPGPSGSAEKKIVNYMLKDVAKKVEERKENSQCLRTFIVINYGF